MRLDSPSGGAHLSMAHGTGFLERQAVLVHGDGAGTSADGRVRLPDRRVRQGDAPGTGAASSADNQQAALAQGIQVAHHAKGDARGGAGSHRADLAQQYCGPGHDIPAGGRHGSAFAESTRSTTSDTTSFNRYFLRGWAADGCCFRCQVKEFSTHNATERSGGACSVA